jgi:PAS domain S-box-containing protein
MASSIELAARLSAVVATQQDVLATITDPDKVMSLVVERTPEVTNGTGAVIEFVSGDELVYRAGSGAAQSHSGLRLSLHSSLSGVAVREKTLVRCDSTESDPRVDGAACRELGIRSMIIAPLLEDQTAVGALKTFSSSPHAFSDLDAYALQLMAGMTSAALTQARTFRQLQLSEARYRMLFEQNVAGVFRTTIDGRILDCNEALAHFLGYDSREDLLAQSAWSLYHNRADREELLRLVQSQSMLNLRMPLARKDGTSLLAVLNASLLPGAGDDRELLGTIVEA